MKKMLVGRGSSAIRKVHQRRSSPECSVHALSHVLMARAQVYKQYVALGAFGASSRKPVFLWSSAAWVAELGDRKLPRGFVNAGDVA